MGVNQAIDSVPIVGGLWSNLTGTGQGSDPSQAYQGAQDTINNTGAQLQNFSGQQWNNANQGTSYANQQLFNLDTPALQQFGQYAQQPSYLQSQMGEYGGGLVSPGMAQGAAQYGMGQLGQPSSTQSAYGGLMSQLQQPGTFEQNMGQLAGMAGSPTALQQFGGQGLNAYNQVGDSTANAAQNNGQLWNNAQGQYGAIQAFQNSQGQLSRMAPNVAQDYSGANATQQFAQQQQPGLGQQTAYEQFADQALNGTNPYYQRLNQQSIDTINQQAAAHGTYNAGGTMAAIGNYLGQSNASQFQDMGNLLQGAAGTGLQRTGLGEQLAQGSDTGSLAQGNAMMGLGQGLQNETLGQRGEATNEENSLANRASTQAGSQLASGQAVDQSLLGRLSGQAGLAGQMSSNQLNQASTLGNLYGQGETFQAQGLAQQAALANQNDTNNYQRLMGGYNMASGADQLTQSGLNSYLGLAGTATGQNNSNNQYLLGQQMGLGSAMGNNTMQGLGMGLSSAYQPFSDAMNAYNQAAMLPVSQWQAQVQQANGQQAAMTNGVATVGKIIAGAPPVPGA